MRGPRGGGGAPCGAGAAAAPRALAVERAHTRLVVTSLPSLPLRLQVKNVFAADTEVYDRFLDIMKNFKAQT